MMLATNGRASDSKRTRHINIRFFFVADRSASKKISLQREPTVTMLADFFTKPLHGAAFREFRDRILGIDNLTSRGVDPTDVGG